MPLAPSAVSVIVTTYNHPRALALVLAGLSRQTAPPGEVLIADDGSGPPTAAVIEQWRVRLPFPLRHVWQPDEGFRKCRILNRAIAAASGDYLVFFDGDCVAPAHCLRAHLDAAREHRYVTGGAVMLQRELSDDERRRGKAEIERIRASGLKGQHVEEPSEPALDVDSLARAFDAEIVNDDAAPAA